MRSKLEEALAQQLDLLARSEGWGLPAPTRELHPFWCCEHAKRQHGRFFAFGYTGCTRCYSPIAEDEEWAHEYDHERDFRVDFAWPASKLAVECEGVRYDAQGGRHQTGAGFAKDLAKYGALELAGWRVVRVGAAQIKDGTAITLIEQALRERVS